MVVTRSQWKEPGLEVKRWVVIVCSKSDWTALKNWKTTEKLHESRNGTCVYPPSITWPGFINQLCHLQAMWFEAKKPLNLAPPAMKSCWLLESQHRQLTPVFIHPTTLLRAYYVSSRDLGPWINSFGEQKSTCIHRAYVPITKYFW